jgi:hypothetical protein
VSGSPRNKPSRSEKAVDRNGGRVFRKDFVVKGAKRRLRRSETLDNKILSKLLLAIAIDGAKRSEKLMHTDCISKGH